MKLLLVHKVSCGSRWDEGAVGTQYFSSQMF